MTTFLFKFLRSVMCLLFISSLLFSVSKPNQLWLKAKLETEKLLHHSEFDGLELGSLCVTAVV